MKIDVDARARLRALIQDLGTLSATAKHLRCSTGYVGDLARGQRDFSDAMLEKLGLRRTIIAADKGK